MLFTCRSSVVALAMGAVLLLTTPAPAQTTYYVNGACGDDSWTGLSPICEAPDGPKATIQAGIDAADHFDAVEVADGIYTGLGNKNLEFFTKEMSIHSAGGPEQCTIDCEGEGFGFTFCTLPDDRPVTIEGFTIRNGQHHFAGGICITAAEVTIDNCIIENCVGTSEGTQTAGGGVCIFRSPVLIARTIIRNNQSARYGGGIAAYDQSSVVIEDSRIESNQAGSDPERSIGAGGGIYIQQHSWFRISRCTIVNNTMIGRFSYGGGIGAGFRGHANPVIVEGTEIRGNRVIGPQGDSSSSGGGATLTSPFILRDCVISDNEAPTSAGLSVHDSGDPSEIRSVRVIGNRAVFDFGGMYHSHSVPPGPWIVDGLTLEANVAGRDGGGLRDFNGGVVWRNVAFIDNVAGRDGGAAYVGGRIDLSHAKFIGNRAGRDGGAIWAEKAVGLSDAQVTRNAADGYGGGLFVRTLLEGTTIEGTTIVANSSGFGGGGIHVEDDQFIEVARVVNSITRDNSPVSIIDNSGTLEVTRSNIEGGWPGVGNLDVDPKFVDPLNGDYRLGAGSPCIDAGDNDFVSSEVDLEGLPRRVDDAGMPDAGIPSAPVVDMGAYEFQGITTGFIAVHPRPGIAGRTNQLRVAGATPGASVYFVYGFASGMANVPGCPGLRVEIANPRIAAQATADGSGYASSVIGIPGAAAGRAIVLQAVDHDACGVSNVVTYRFP